MGSKSRLVRSISTSSGDDAKDVSSSLSGNPWWCLVGEAMGDTDIEDTVNGEGGVDTQGTRCDSGGGGGVHLLLLPLSLFIDAREDVLGAGDGDGTL